MSAGRRAPTPEPSGRLHAPLIVLEIVDDEPHAAIVCGYLESIGVACLREPFTPPGRLSLRSLQQRWRVVVGAHDEERARAALDELNVPPQ